jgi:hypothetical protein
VSKLEEVLTMKIKCFLLKPAVVPHVSLMRQEPVVLKTVRLDLHAV